MLKRAFARETFIIQNGDALRIAAVADTHSKPHPSLGERLREALPTHIVHAGDIGDLGVLRELERHAPVVAVRGNIDERAKDLPDVVTIDVRDEAGTLLKILLVHIAVNGPKIRADIARIARAEDASLVVCGHSHIPFAAHDRGLTVFNPGSVGPRRFQLPIVLGILDISRSGVSVRHIDCETGRAWSPKTR
jgi:putative phosphoesterase